MKIVSSRRPLAAIRSATRAASGAMNWLSTRTALSSPRITTESTSPASGPAEQLADRGAARGRACAEGCECGGASGEEGAAVENEHGIISGAVVTNPHSVICRNHPCGGRRHFWSTRYEKGNPSAADGSCGAIGFDPSSARCAMSSRRSATSGPFGSDGPQAGLPAFYRGCAGTFPTSPSACSPRRCASSSATAMSFAA